MSLRSSLWRYLGLLAVAALAAGVFAGPASAKKLSAKQRAAVRTQLKKEIKKNPAAINRKSFIKRASLVNFTLPVTIRLRDGDKPGTVAKESATSNPNNANIDLGASLGTRQVSLGGSLSAEITFHDSFDGGALGNVDLSILPSANHHLTSTSIPLLWNPQVSAGTYAANALGAGTSGCGDFVGDSALPFGPFASGFPYFASPTAAGAFAASLNTDLTQIGGYLPEKPGVDGTNRILAGTSGPTAGQTPGDNNSLGANPDPFPQSSQSDPGADGTFASPTAADTVLRTNALSLGIAGSGTEVDQFTANANHPQGSQNIVMGKSGGQANLFGNIPGKGYGVDVTVNLETKINSILRIVDQDSTGYPLITGHKYPAGIFNCRQIYTGAVQNYIPAVHLQGSLKIAPAVSADGKLRIAKATLSQLGTEPSRFAVSACLAPYASYAAPQLTADLDGSAVPAATNVSGTSPGSTVADAALPADVTQVRPTPSTIACNAPPTGLVANSAFTEGGFSVAQLAGGTLASAIANGYTTNNDGSKVSVAADLTVGQVVADVMIGDV